MTRIHYKTADGIWYESAPILTGHGHTIVVYNKERLEFSLLTYETRHVIILERCKNILQLKKNIRERLISIGANFQSEIRNRK